MALWSKSPKSAPSDNSYNAIARLHTLQAQQEHLEKMRARSHDLRELNDERDRERARDERERQHEKDVDYKSRWFRPAPENPTFPINKKDHLIAKLIKGIANREVEGWRAENREREYKRDQKKEIAKRALEMKMDEGQREGRLRSQERARSASRQQSSSPWDDDEPRYKPQLLPPRSDQGGGEDRPWKKVKDIIGKWRDQRPDRKSEEQHTADDAMRQKLKKQYGPDTRGEPIRETAARTDPHRAEGLDRITDAHLRAKELEEAWKKNHDKGLGHPESGEFHPAPGEVADRIAKRWAREPDPRQPWREKVPIPPLDKEGRAGIARAMGRQVGLNMPKPESTLSKWYKDITSRPSPAKQSPLPPWYDRPGEKPRQRQEPKQPEQPEIKRSSRGRPPKARAAPDDRSRGPAQQPGGL